jgi:hypothetical protein
MGLLIWFYTSPSLTDSFLGSILNRPIRCLGLPVAWKEKLGAMTWFMAKLGSIFRSARSRMISDDPDEAAKKSLVVTCGAS